MEILYGLGLALVAVFSLALGWYVVQYKLPVRGVWGRGLAFATLSILLFVVTFTASVFIAWPPILPL